MKGCKKEDRKIKENKDREEKINDMGNKESEREIIKVKKGR